MNGKQIDVDLFRYLSSRHHEIVGLPAAPRTEQMWLGCQGRSTERKAMESLYLICDQAT